MTKVIDATNVNDAVSKGLTYLLMNGIREDSRNGVVIVAPGPVCTEYSKPTQRVLFSPLRDANPFFHLMESIWMIAGDRKLNFLLNFNRKFGQYSDDGETVHGAYGHRWRNWFQFDQINEIVNHLKESPNSRRAVLTIWSPIGDLVKACDEYGYLEPAIHEEDFPNANVFGGMSGKDVPCNTHAYFDLRAGVLNMTVCCRSNDAIWGAYGANVVHFSFLQEYMAALLDAEVGVYRQFSNNFHAYTDIYSEEKLAVIADQASKTNMYEQDPNMKIIPFMDKVDCNRACEEFVTLGVTDTSQRFLKEVAEPMMKAYLARQTGKKNLAYAELQAMPYCDWQVAALRWFQRRDGGSNAA